MDSLEKKLFKGHMDSVDKIILSGLVRLKWSSKGILEGFVRECRRSCNEIYMKLKMFKNNTKKIEDKCQEISSKLLIKIEKKKVTEIKAFEDD